MISLTIPKSICETNKNCYNNLNFLSKKNGQTYLISYVKKRVCYTLGKVFRRHDDAQYIKKMPFYASA